MISVGKSSAAQAVSKHGHQWPPRVCHLPVALTLAPGQPLQQRVTLRIASTLYDELRPVSPFVALGSHLEKPVTVLAPDVDEWSRR
jgi:hypothetical protein